MITTLIRKKDQNNERLFGLSGLRVETRIDYILGMFWTDIIQGVNLDKFDCCPELRI